MNQKKKFLILDLDNTLYDWVTYYGKSFRAMLDKLVRLSGISKEQLILEFREIHQKYQSSEYAFSIQKLPSLHEKHFNLTEEEIRKKYWDAVIAFRNERKKHFVLYPEVRKTLRRLSEGGVTIIGHSDAMDYYALRRLQRLKLEHFFKCLYAVKEHEIPGYANNELKLYSNIEMEVRTLPQKFHKPNPIVLNRILDDWDISKDLAVYVGDSLQRDIAMANQVGIFSVWAHYGTLFDKKDFELLVAITHWTKDDVNRELDKGEEIVPSMLIHNFSEIDTLFL